MIISPPFLPDAGLAASTGTNPDPIMDAVDRFECAHGIYPIAFDRRWHCGVHLQPDTKDKVYAIADGEVVAYRVCQHAIDDGASHTGFVLLRHTTETGDGRTLTFYSLYMHLLPLVEYQQHSANANEMPEFLRMPTGDPVAQVPPAVAGNKNLKVKRKDVLGWLGQYEGMPHLHFEIFMVQADFDTYFGHTQLGNTTPAQPTGTDWWGHAYFVIPANSTFFSLPTGTVTDAHQKHKLHDIEFELGQGGPNTLPLLVETYFSRGSKYTNVWSVAQDGTRTPLTSQPVEEKDYEYDLYTRAKALYSTCPSDGYELLRFGRILSATQTLAADARVTWMQVTWAANQQGYIDINDSSIQKFSDADFLSFVGWQKVSDGNTPFGSDGLCDVDALKKILNDAAPHEIPAVAGETPEAHKTNVLSTYVKGNDQVRQQLRGLVCQAPSEWDSTNNEERYTKLLDEGGFYHGNQQGYNDFLKYLKEVQFWDKTGLPAGQKLWFFHPLAFIRHFRRCGWLSLDELSRLLPRKYGLNHAGATLTWETARGRVSGGTIKHAGLCETFRKYGFSTAERQIAFLSQAYIETGLLRTTSEDGQGHGTGNAQYYQAFYGRGLMQLTWPTLYDDYGKFRRFSPNNTGHYADPRITQTSTHYWSGPPTVDSHGHTHSDRRQWYPRYDPDVVVCVGSNACDSAGFFWIWKHFMGVTNISRIADTGITTVTVGRMSILVNGGGNGYDDRQQYAAYLLRYRGDTTDSTTGETLTFARQRIVSHAHQMPTWGASTTVSHVYVDFTPQRPA